MIRYFFALSVLGLILAAGSPTASAKNEHAKGHGKSNHAEKMHEKVPAHDTQDEDRIFLQLDAPQLEILRTNFAPYYGKHCPPGLAKKHNGCLPPGQAKRYAIGQTLPEGLEYWNLPPDMLTLLPHAPRGTRYVGVDKDVLLISEAGKKVLDAITLLSAVD